MFDFDAIIIGSGPAGLTAAKAAADAGKSVLVLERGSEPSKKLYATGNGRCNFLNRNMEGAEEVLSYCNSIGIIEAEEDGRLYPRNFQAASVVKILNFAAAKAGAQLKCGVHVTAVHKSERGFEVEWKTEEGSGHAKEEKDLPAVISCGNVVIATGGKAGIQYGCTGDGYRFAQSLGHSVVKPIPALTGLETAQDITMLHGVRINAQASLFGLDGDGNRTLLAHDGGEVQFTKDAISGICIMNLSRMLRFEEGRRFELSLDMYPEYSQEELLALFKHQIKAAGCAMEGLVPEKMHDYLHTRISPEEHNPVTMSALSKNLCFEITNTRGWKNAQVTCGGVPLDEVTENYESKTVPGLFFAGEVLDYDGPCGGYNIGFAIKSGLAAGTELGKKE